MHPDFWHQRWREGRIGFHQTQVTPLLERHWTTVAASPGSRVFVPLCGKAVDMPWLAAQGHEVLGSELSQLAVDQFFDGLGVRPDVHESRYGRHHVAAGIELIVGDVFDLDAEALAGCRAVFDRAALIALPADLRHRYAREVYGALPASCRGLLVTLEYPPAEKAGPPFPVGEAEVRERFEPAWSVERLERRDILDEQPGFVEEGVTALTTSAYRLQRSL